MKETRAHALKDMDLPWQSFLSSSPCPPLSSLLFFFSSSPTSLSLNFCLLFLSLSLSLTCIHTPHTAPEGEIRSLESKTEPFCR